MYHCAPGELVVCTTVHQDNWRYVPPCVQKEQQGGRVGARLVETRNMRSLAGGSVAGLSFPRTCFHDAPADEKGDRVFLQDMDA